MGEVLEYEYRFYLLTAKGKEEQTMAYVISDDCVSCGTCESECPVGAISQGDAHYEINPDECVDCGTCAAACPTEAISQG